MFVPPTPPDVATTARIASGNSDNELGDMKNDAIHHPHLDEPLSGTNNIIEHGNDGAGKTYHASGLTDWAEHHRQHYLEELMRHDGRAGCEKCAECANDGVYRCKDCFGYQLYCKTCFVGRHSQIPFHRALVCLRSSPSSQIPADR